MPACRCYPCSHVGGRGGAGRGGYLTTIDLSTSVTMFIFTSTNPTHVALSPSSKTYRIHELQFCDVAMATKLAVRQIKKISPCITLTTGFVASKIREAWPRSFAPISFSSGESDWCNVDEMKAEDELARFSPTLVQASVRDWVHDHSIGRMQRHRTLPLPCRASPTDAARLSACIHETRLSRRLLRISSASIYISDTTDRLEVPIFYYTIPFGDFRHTHLHLPNPLGTVACVI